VSVNRTGWIAAALFALFACDRGGATKAGTAEPPSGPPVPVPDTASEQKRVHAAALQTAVTAFTNASSAHERWRAYLHVLEELDEAGDLANEAQFARFRNSTAQKLSQKMVDWERQEDGMKAELAAPPPEKPQYEPPAYDGAFYLEGPVQKCYDDGVALQAGSAYYFVRDARCPDMPRLQGYVEKSGLGTITIDLGRDGREATVVEIKDRATMEDDKRAHARELHEYDEGYRRDLAAYRTEQARRASLGGATGLIQKNSVAQDHLLTILDPVLIALAADQTIPEVAADELARDERQVTDPRGDDGGKTRPQAVQAVATSSPRPRAAHADTVSCMKGCITECKGEPVCERRCAARKCS
jgi:hypothetical protein